MANRQLIYPATVHADTTAAERKFDRLGQKIRTNGPNIGAFTSAQRPMGKLTGLATEFEKSMEAANARVLAFGASVGVIVGVKNAFVGLVKESVKFNDELVKINAVMNVSSSTLAKFGDSLFGIAQGTAQDIRNVSAAALEFSRQGLGMAETLKRTEAAMMLTRVAGIDAADATRKLTAAVNSFKDQGIGVTEVMDRIIKVEQGFAVDTNDLTSAIERAGSVAVAAGVDFNQFLGIVTAVQERTARGGAVIGNAMKTIFTRLQSESKIKNLENILNINLFDEQNNPEDMITRINKIAAALDKVKDPLKREKAIFEIGGTYQKNIAEALIADINSGQSKMVQAAEDAANATGTAFSKNLQLNTSLSAQFDSIVQQVKELAVNLAELGATDWIQSLLSMAKSFIGSISALLERTDALGVAFRGVVKGLSALLGPAGLVGLAVVARFFVDFVKFAKDSVQSLLHVNNVSNKQKILENEINGKNKHTTTYKYTYRFQNIPKCSFTFG
jgi:TP901 family phage tail tape measure protein